MNHQNDIFKLMVLRGPEDGLTIEPTNDISDSEVLKRLKSDNPEENLFVDPLNPSEEVINRLKDMPLLSKSQVDKMKLKTAYRIFFNRKIQSYSQLTSQEFDEKKAFERILEIAESEDFTENYRQLTDTWLLLKLNKKQGSLLDKIEDFIRAAHITLRLQNRPNSLKEPGALAHLLKAKIVFPLAWRKAQSPTNGFFAPGDTIPPVVPAVNYSKPKQEINKKKQEYVALSNKIKTRESIQSKAHRAYWKWKKQDGVSDQTTPQLNATFYQILERQLNENEQQEMISTFGAMQGPTDIDFDDFVVVISADDAIVDANEACTRIRIWEEEIKEKLPPAQPYEPTDNRPAIKELGIGDLVVARERLIGYEANEIAHIENVLPGEEKIREHERTKTTEEFIETETLEETETERDLQTTDRQELQSESEKTIQQDFGIDTGVNTSGTYGLTTVDTSTNLNFNRSTSEARNSSTNLAKEIVSRSKERVFESIRKLRRLTITEQIRELNTHSIKNTAGDGNSGSPSAFSGIYKWVEKIQEVELRHYGKRLLFEFHIPEPAISLLEFNDKPEVNVRKPAPLAFGPTDITQANYLCLTKLFGAQEVEPPPSQFVETGYFWQSTPDEAADSTDNNNRYNAEDVTGEFINIPEGYMPIRGRALISTPIVQKPDKNQDKTWPFLYLAVGGIKVIDTEVSTDVLEFSKEEEFKLSTRNSWPQGLPVSLLAKGHYDKTLSLHVKVICERTPETLTNWQLRTWEKIKEAHQILVQDYESAVEEAEFQDNQLVQIQSRPTAENRRIERDELKKWAVKIMRHPNQFDFSAVEQQGDFQEINVQGADEQAPIINFFEQAFEWHNMSYFFYPYYWGRRDAWRMRQNTYDKADPVHNAFMQAGAARVIVPVTPGYESRIHYYLGSESLNELDKINMPTEQPEADLGGTEYEDLWLEILVDRKEEVSRGSGTLSVQKGKTQVRLNEDSEWRGQISDRDIGREIYIDGHRYIIQSIEPGQNRFSLNEPYRGKTDESVKYATGSVPYSAPWQVRVPTALVVLSEETEKLNG